MFLSMWEAGCSLKTDIFKNVDGVVWLNKRPSQILGMDSMESWSCTVLGTGESGDPSNEMQAVANINLLICIIVFHFLLCHSNDYYISNSFTVLSKQV